MKAQDSICSSDQTKANIFLIQILHKGDKFEILDSALHNFVWLDLYGVQFFYMQRF